jgi:hypothetical protein
MPLLSLSQAYHIAPKRDVARPQAPLATPTVDPDARGRREQPAERDPGHGRNPDEPRDCDSAQRSPLLQALKLALGPAPSASVRDEVTLERALIAFARALNQATHDADAAAQPAAVRADDVARRRARNEEQLLASFAALQQAAGRSVTSPQALQNLLGDFLHQLARQLNVDEQHAGDVTQPGSLISIRA